MKTLIKTLIVEDEFVSRKILQEFLSNYAKCDIAVDGEEALNAFKIAWEQGLPYELICIDIMLPKLDGQIVLQEIRRFEKEKCIPRYSGVKVIMTTANDDADNIVNAFKYQNDAYLVKPIDLQKLINELKILKLI